MKKFTTLFICLGISLAGIAQNVGIGTPTPNASALLELQSTNKGLLMPRVADTNAVPSPVKGLLIFSNASNSLWFYNGSSWQKANGSAATDNIWEAKGDSAATTGRKYVRINSGEHVMQSVQGLTVDGSLVIQQKTTVSKTAPTAAQTVTMDNTSEFQEFPDADSAIRIFDPGGTNANYSNNMQGNVIINAAIATFSAADFGIAVGDTLWISPVSFPACRINYSYRFTNTTVAPPAIWLGNPSYFIFRSNADNINGKGFDITFKRLYPVASETEFTKPGGNGLFFDIKNSAFRAGYMSYGVIGRYSAAIGNGNAASGLYSIAMGNGSAATEEASIALGNFTSATGYRSIALGSITRASGSYATAFGNYTIASGYGATAMGDNTNAKSFLSMAIGSNNDTSTTLSSSNWIATDPLLYIGNGQGGNKSNAMVVYKNANVDINGYTRLGKLSEATPAIKMKELIVTSAATSTGQSAINHGIDASKIISVTTLLEWSTNFLAPPEYSPDPLLRYNYFVSPTQIVIQNNAASCAYICSKTVKVLITYKE